MITEKLGSGEGQGKVKVGSETNVTTRSIDVSMEEGGRVGEANREVNWVELFKRKSGVERFWWVYNKWMFLVGTAGNFGYYVQAIRIYRTMEAKSLSTLTYSIFVVIHVSFLVHALHMRDRVLAAANGVALIGAVLCLIGILVTGDIYF